MGVCWSAGAQVQGQDREHALLIAFNSFQGLLDVFSQQSIATFLELTVALCDLF